MRDAFAGPMDRARSVLSTISVGQKVVIGLLAAGLVLGGIIFTQWITAPTYSPLFTNLSATDAGAIKEELDAEGVDSTIEDGGQTIMVPKDQVYDLRLSLSGKGLPAGSDTGYALLDEQGITTSEFQQQKNYQRAMEGELAKTLEAIDGVNTAVVHLAIPSETVFVSDQNRPTASVLLDLAPGAALSGGQVQAVTNLVSSSIEGMTPEDVTVSDSNANVLSAAGGGYSAGATDVQAQQERDYEAGLVASAQTMLDRLVGPGRAVVTVKADLDFSQRASTSERYEYNQDTPPLSSQTTTETYNGTGGAPVGGVLGPENQAGAGTGTDPYNYSQESETNNNAVDRTVETVEGAPGDVNRLSVAVVLDNDGAAGPTPNPAVVQEVVTQAVGLDVARGDKITVASMAFDTSAAERAAADLAAAAAADEEARMWSLIRTGAIALGILLIVLLAWWRSRRNRPALEDDEYHELELSDDHMAELERLRVESSRDEQMEARRMALEGEARERVRGEISEMISERPDEVATMLRSWFAEAR
jgi:flagellar M-ring protein FliF